MHASSGNLWFRILNRCTAPQIRLLCFPHAGGAASFFRSWSRFTPAQVELVAVRYPGREDRLLDPLPDDMLQLIEPLSRECARLLDVPLALFGHSMGASVAYEVALRLRADHRTEPAALFVSGCPGPGRETVSRHLADASDSELIAELDQLSSMTEALDDPELRALILPVLRSDFRLTERYRATTARPALSAPVVAYYGTRDQDVDEDAVAAWSEVTRSTFRLRAFDGGHFYLVDRAEEMLADLFTRLGAVPARQEIPVPSMSTGASQRSGRPSPPPSRGANHD